MLATVFFIFAFLLGVVTGAQAQQPSPADQLAQAQAMVSTLYRQLNTAIQDSAQQEAARIKMQADLDKLKAQVSELQKKDKSSPQAQAQDERKETR